MSRHSLRNDRRLAQEKKTERYGHRFHPRSSSTSTGHTTSNYGESLRRKSSLSSFQTRPRTQSVSSRLATAWQRKFCMSFSPDLLPHPGWKYLSTALQKFSRLQNINRQSAGNPQRAKQSLPRPLSPPENPISHQAWRGFLHSQSELQTCYMRDAPCCEGTQARNLVVPCAARRWSVTITTSSIQCCIAACCVIIRHEVDQIL